MPTLPMAAALSAANLAGILFPESLRRLYVARDFDSAGKRAAARLVDRANAAGIEAIVLSPSLKDFNDDLQSAGRRGHEGFVANAGRQGRRRQIHRFRDMT